MSEGDNIGHEIITFPSKEKELNILCNSLGVVNTAKTEVEIGTVYNDDRFINLCFNIHCYILVADFSDLNAVCKQMYLTEQISVSTEDFESFDG